MSGRPLPWPVRRAFRRGRNALALARLLVRQRRRLREIAAAAPSVSGIAVSYGIERMPAPDEIVFGGFVKFALLHEQLPNAPRDFNLLYLGSSSMPLEAAALARLARRRGAPFVWNQNGVAYPGWHGPGWELVNRSRARLLRRADHVVYQTAFCKLAADRFYGEPSGSWEILPNPVDTRRFTPAPERTERPLTILLGGNQYQRYRLTTALEAFALVRSERPDARLLVAGALGFAPDGPAAAAALVRGLGLEGAVAFAGPYTQSQAPDLLRQADLLLHTKYNDPCPTVVLEAMACGLPIVYSASGGVPELVDEGAGVGVPAPVDWERDHPPAPAALAEAVLQVAERLPERSEAARRRALDFDAQRWIDRHRALFAELLAGRARRGTRLS